MPAQKPEKMTPEQQLEAFKRAAKAIGTDDDPERFKEMVRKVGDAKPAPAPTKGKRS